ncbi:MAG TPA: hypothetical protein VM101_15885 [Flavitalea sp.]|nr:hypothetical protein [Flavitalea sp.]
MPYLRTLHIVLITLFFAQVSLCQQVPKFNSNSAAAATVYLDFDGQVVKGTAWNWDSTIHAKPAGASSSVITEIFNRVAEDFRIFNLNITTDSSVFKKAPVAKRMRVIITPTSNWYGSGGGVSFVNSFSWGDDTPAWVFSNLLENNRKYIAEAISHEIGHTLGLQHQSTYTKNCDLVNEYAEGRGTGEIGWAPIMGVGYYKNLTLWTIGSSIESCSTIQNDISIISNGYNHIGLRGDDHGNNSTSSTTLILSNNNFAVNGIINHSADRDFFKIILSRTAKLKAKITPNNVGVNNSGADIDLSLILTNASGDTIRHYNPKTLLNVTIDTVLVAGIYYFNVDGTGNQNVSDYGSVGLYSLSGSVENLTIARTVLLRGDIKRQFNIIHWDGYPNPQVRTTYIEYSLDGKIYTPFKDVPLNATTYTHQPPGGNPVYYRLRMIRNDESTEYSNVVTLNSTTGEHVWLAGNIVKEAVQVRTIGKYWYQLFDETGRLLGEGSLNTGSNNIPLTTLNHGIILLKVFNKTENLHYRIIKQ